MSRLKVLVLMGGNSPEREVSLSTGRQILGTLAPERYEAIGMDAAVLSLSPFSKHREGKLPDAGDCEGAEGEVLSKLPKRIAEIMAEEASGSVLKEEGNPSRSPDVVFIAMHGPGGEDGKIQGLLDTLQIPYTGSGVLASALAMNKVMSKRLMRAAGIPVPRDIVIAKGDKVSDLVDRVERSLRWPVIVKPNEQGSTIGMSIARRAEDLDEALKLAMRYDRVVLIEEYIHGVEITAGLIGNENPRVLPLIEIVTPTGFYDYDAKYKAGGSEHIIPARISNEMTRKAQAIAAQVYVELGCRGMSRVDMMVRGEEIFVLEANTIPGMTPTSLLPQAAEAAGIGFRELLDEIIRLAIE